MVTMEHLCFAHRNKKKNIKTQNYISTQRCRLLYSIRLNACGQNAFKKNKQTRPFYLLWKNDEEYASDLLTGPSRAFFLRNDLVLLSVGFVL